MEGGQGKDRSRAMERWEGVDRRRRMEGGRGIWSKEEGEDVGRKKGET